MNSTTNIALLSSAAALISLGVTIISTVLLTGSVEIILGIVLFAVYELTPTKTV